MDKLSNMQAFAMVGQTGNFAEAARRLSVANSVVSKRVKDLEDFLGTQLLIRTTRKVRLTDAGYDYLEYVRKCLDEMTEVEAAVRHQAQKPVGMIKVAAPQSFGRQYLGPALATYLEKYPDVSLKVYLSDKRVDLLEEGFDLAITIGVLQDSTLIARKLGDCRRVVCASPHYFEQHGKPKTPHDLSSHNCLSYLNLAEGKAWPFWMGGKRVWQPVSGRFSADNGDILYQAALTGAGITLLPTFIVGKAVESGKLQVVLEQYEEQNFSIYALYQHKRHLSTKVRMLIDHLTQCFERGFMNVHDEVKRTASVSSKTAVKKRVSHHASKQQLATEQKASGALSRVRRSSKNTR
jgi:DNA-binding transcriptional LysR family regulator